MELKKKNASDQYFLKNRAKILRHYRITPHPFSLPLSSNLSSNSISLCVQLPPASIFPICAFRIRSSLGRTEAFLFVYLYQKVGRANDLRFPFIVYDSKDLLPNDIDIYEKRPQRAKTSFLMRSMSYIRLLRMRNPYVEIFITVCFLRCRTSGWIDDGRVMEWKKANPDIANVFFFIAKCLPGLLAGNAYIGRNCTKHG